MQDSIPIRGLHHVTATVGDAQQDLDFYVGTLGLRLVKKTVNFDNHRVYHLYYGDRHGSPGTLMTTFPYEGWGVRPGVHGTGQITVTAFSVPEGSLGFWEARLEKLGVTNHQPGRRFDEQWITFGDPSGLVIELVETGKDDRPPWLAEGISQDVAIRGLHGITMAIREPTSTIDLLTEVLGWTVVNEAAGRTRLGIDGDTPGRIIDVLHAPDAPQAINGLGTVHHVAMAVDGGGAQLAAREELLRLGLQVTEVHDRQYFRSIYFREPGGVLYEIATLGPGFLVDEELQDLRAELKLPPWEEPHREEIEEHLPAVSYSLGEEGVSGSASRSRR